MGESGSVAESRRWPKKASRGGGLDFFYFCFHLFTFVAQPPAFVPGCRDLRSVDKLSLAPCCQVAEDGCNLPIIGSTRTRGVEKLLHLLDLILA
jgi:hypothetical protein